MPLYSAIKDIIPSLDYSTPHASFVLPFDTTIMEKYSEVAEKYSEYKNIALIGIGGSNL
jgi:hypothetical protein